MGNKRRTEAVDDDFDWYMPNDPGRSSLVVNCMYIIDMIAFIFY